MEILSVAHALCKMTISSHIFAGFLLVEIHESETGPQWKKKTKTKT